MKNPCPAHLQAQYSGLNSNGNGAATCFMWDPVVVQAYVAMLRAAAARYDAHPRVEGIVIQESALGFSGAYSQDVTTGGTYTPKAWRDALMEVVGQCGSAFSQSRCMVFLNFIRGRQDYLHDVADAIAAVPDNRACISSPDVLPDSSALHEGESSIYQVAVRHSGCRANSVQNDSYAVSGCDLECIFRFAVGGTMGQFPHGSPRSGGLCVNSYLFWSHVVDKSATGLDWKDASAVIAANPYGQSWHQQCENGGSNP
jgi:hypothetical protein